jgi:GNAT superfamily N-acetyltransferase
VVAGFAADFDVLAFNRIVGLGLAAPATPAQIDRLVAVAAEAGVRRLFVQLAPGHEPDGIADWLRARGGREHNRWVRHWRRAASPPRVETALSVQPIGAAHSAEFAAVLVEGFGLPDGMRPWIAASVGRPGWRHYGAFDGTRLVATGALRPTGEIGWLGQAATRATHRGRGAQGALLARRIEDAAALGCEWVVVETAEDAPAHSAPSHRNVRRLGFTEAYRRPNYLITLG